MSAISKLPKETQLYILAGLVVGVCGLFYFYYINPLHSEISAIQMENESLRAEIAAGQALSLQLNELRKSVEDQRAKLSDLRAILPESKETAEIIRQVETLAKDSNLQIMSFTPRGTVNNVFYEDWPIAIALEGNYDNLGNFFQKISEFTRLINVDNIKIATLKEGASRSRTLSATCTATTFVYLEEEAQSKEEAR